MKRITRFKAFRLLTLLACFLLMAGCNNNENPDKMQDKKTDTAAPGISAVNARTMYAEIDGRKIAYRSMGNGRPLVLCQRFRGNLDSWDPAFLDALARNYQVIIFDYTGFGLSTGTAPTTMTVFAKDVKDLCRFLKLDKIIVGGWSFGGAVAQVAMTEFTDLITQTILLGTKPPGKTTYPMEQAFLERSSKPQNDLDDEIVLFFEPTSKISTAAAKASHDRIAARTTDNDVYIKQELWANYSLGFADYAKDSAGVLQKMMTTSTPILVISADHEVVFPPENWFVLNRKLPTTQVVVIPQTGHGPHHQYPEMVAAYIHSFIINNTK